jgi:diketogulonate reductase-like aldo/keto reductase
MSTTATIPLPSGESIPVLGQGTWGYAEGVRPRAQEIAALRHALHLGVKLIDTAEMYADGAAEELVGEAVAGRRDDVFLVSKVLPYNATRRGTVAACEASLRRLGTDRLDLYLLHWRGSVPLEETLEAFDDLAAAGRIRHWGVSNLDVADMGELARVARGDAVAVDQVLYHLGARGIEFDLLPSCRERGIPVMAYSPFGRGRILDHGALRGVGADLGATPAQVALAWVLRQEGVNAIPRAGSPEHVAENRAALDLRLGADHLAALDEAFPAPTRPVPLEVL